MECLRADVLSRSGPQGGFPWDVALGFQKDLEGRVGGVSFRFLMIRVCTVVSHLFFFLVVML